MYGSAGNQYVLTGVYGFEPNACWRDHTQCIVDSEFLMAYPDEQEWGVEDMGSYVNVYTQDPMLPHIFNFSASYPKCICDSDNTTDDCTNPHTSSLSDQYCVDMATYSGPPIGWGDPRPTPIRFFWLAGAIPGGMGPIPGIKPGLISKSARVGVNTLLPTAALDVIGDVRFTSYAGTGTRNLGVASNGDVVILPTI
jgi:hypothetical protein